MHWSRAALPRTGSPPAAMRTAIRWRATPARMVAGRIAAWRWFSRTRRASCRIEAERRQDALPVRDAAQAPPAGRARRLLEIQVELALFGGRVEAAVLVEVEDGFHHRIGLVDQTNEVEVARRDGALCR